MKILPISCDCGGQEFLWDDEVGEIVCTTCGKVVVSGREEAFYRYSLESGSIWRKEQVLLWKN